MLNVGERNPNGGEMRMALCQETFEDKQHKRPSSQCHLVQPHSSPGMGALPPSPRGGHTKAERLA